MPIRIPSAVASLRSTAAAIEALVLPLSIEEARWKPGPQKWSILEVLNHLADEEAEDFRARLALILSDSGEPFSTIDPPGWVTSRHYSERGHIESLRRFLGEREKSVAWLMNLSSPDLERSRRHPVAGKLSGMSMLASWVAHDLLHVRQIVRLRYERLAAESAPESLDYAGRW